MPRRALPVSLAPVVLAPVVLAPAVVAVAAIAVQAARIPGARTMTEDHAAFWRRRGRSPGGVLLVALGDSLAQGIGARRPGHSWVGRLAVTLEADRGVRVRVLNLGVGGATTAQVRRDQLPCVPAAALRGGPDVVVALCVGTNDAASSTPPEDYRRELDAICARLPAGSLVADVPDLQRGAVRPAGARLAAIAREVVGSRPGLRLVRLEEATRRLRPWELGPDLAHPSGLGYRRFGRAFATASRES